MISIAGANWSWSFKFQLTLHFCEGYFFYLHQLCCGKPPHMCINLCPPPTFPFSLHKKNVHHPLTTIATASQSPYNDRLTKPTHPLSVFYWTRCNTIDSNSQWAPFYSKVTCDGICRGKGISGVWLAHHNMQWKLNNNPSLFTNSCFGSTSMALGKKWK